MGDVVRKEIDLLFPFLPRVNCLAPSAVRVLQIKIQSREQGIGREKVAFIPAGKANPSARAHSQEVRGR